MIVGGIILALVILGLILALSRRAEAPAPVVPIVTDEGPAPELGAEGELSLLDGTWQSTADAKFIREFNADGGVTDRYEGDPGATAAGSWTIIANVTAEPVLLPETDLPILKLVFPASEPLYFSISDLTDTSLTLTYLDRGGALSFTRVR